MSTTAPRLTPSTDLLQEVNDLQDHVRRLRALLDLQRRQMTGLEARFFPAGPAGVAARWLLALKEGAAR